MASRLSAWLLQRLPATRVRSLRSMPIRPGTLSRAWKRWSSLAGTNLTPDAMRHQIASALDVVLQVARLSDGNRKVVSVCEVVGMETDVVTMQEIFAFDRHGINAEGKVIGEFRALLLTTFLSVTVAALAAGFMLGSRRQQALRRALRSRRAPAIN